MNKKLSNTPLVSLIIPTFNEALNIPSLIPTLSRILDPYDHEIIIVDDDSPDLTWKLAQDIAQANAHVKVIRRKNKRGLSSAVIEGFDLALGQIFVVMDADFSHDEKILPNLINEVLKGNQMAVGSRRISGGGANKWPAHRKGMSSIATYLAKWLLDLPLSDPMSGYFSIHRSLYESCRDQLKPMGYKILLDLYCRTRPSKVKEIPFVFKDRTQGYSKLSGRVIQQYLTMIMELRKERYH